MPAGGPSRGRSARGLDAPEAGGETGNGTIRSEAEVFEIMRGFGPFGGGKEG